jgi:hypothetical protein
MRYLFLVMLITGCSSMTAREKCILASTGAGAAAGTSLALIGAIASDCTANCQEHKIHSGEPLHEALQHHYSTFTTVATYGGIAGFLVGGAIGAGVGYLACTEKPNELGSNNATVPEGGKGPQGKTTASQATNQPQTNNAGLEARNGY